MLNAALFGYKKSYSQISTNYLCPLIWLLFRGFLEVLYLWTHAVPLRLQMTNKSSSNSPLSISFYSNLIHNFAYLSLLSQIPTILFHCICLSFRSQMSTKLSDHSLYIVRSYTRFSYGFQLFMLVPQQSIAPIATLNSRLERF